MPEETAAQVVPPDQADPRVPVQEIQDHARGIKAVPWEHDHHNDPQVVIPPFAITAAYRHVRPAIIAAQHRNHALSIPPPSHGPQ